MNCLETQELLLASFELPLLPEEKRLSEDHIASCPDCARFAAEHALLEVRLREAITAPSLGRGFRAELRARMKQRRERWPDWLPDAAYLVGAGLAFALCVLLLPLPTAVVLKTGSMVIFLAYILQTLLVSVLEQKTD